jgi:ABC-type cobalamin/Fe3+-siderophores transport system ATPase subunit
MRKGWQGTGQPCVEFDWAGGELVAAVAEFDSVGLRYGTGAEVLRDLDFRLRFGTFYFLTGPSGAGKTSLLKLLYLAQRPTRGRIRLFGEELSEAPREALPPYALVSLLATYPGSSLDTWIKYTRHLVTEWFTSTVRTFLFTEILRAAMRWTLISAWESVRRSRLWRP